MLHENLQNLKDFIKSYIETQQTVLNTMNPDFISLLVNSTPVNQMEFLTMDNNKLITEDERKHLLQQMLCGRSDIDINIATSKHVKIHKHLTACYFDFIRTQVRDFVPKRIKHKMINLVLKDFENRLYNDLFTSYGLNKSFDEILEEEDEIVEDRIQAENLLDAVNKALQNMIDIQCS